MKSTVGFIGLGVIGLPMAERLQPGAYAALQSALLRTVVDSTPALVLLALLVATLALVLAGPRLVRLGLQ